MERLNGRFSVLLFSPKDAFALGEALAGLGIRDLLPLLRETLRQNMQTFYSQFRSKCKRFI